MWYVIQVQTRRETEIAGRCRDKIMRPDEDVFVILRERMYRTERGREKILVPVFPGYVFVETGDIDDFRIRLYEIKTMTKVLRAGEETVPVYPEEEAFLRKISGEDHIIRFSGGYEIGKKLTVTEGPLKGYEGRVKRIDRHKKYAVLEVSLMGQTVDVQMGIEVFRKE